MSVGLSLSLGVGVRRLSLSLCVDVSGTAGVIRCKCQWDCLCR